MIVLFFCIPRSLITRTTEFYEVVRNGPQGIAQRVTSFETESLSNERRRSLGEEASLMRGRIEEYKPPAREYWVL